MYQFTNWVTVDRAQWTLKKHIKQYGIVLYEVSSLPDFTEPRFSYMCKEADSRKNEVIKRQIQMVRQFHALNRNWAISLRLVKEQSDIKLFLVFRYVYATDAEKQIRESESAIIANALMRGEYTFQQVTATDRMDCALCADWANEVTEVSKQEQEYLGDLCDVIPGKPFQERFYVPFAWNASDGNMETICEALLRHHGRAAVNITIIPEQWLDDERVWLGNNVEKLKEAMNGAVFRSGNKTLWTGRKLPNLKAPLENCEKISKQYETSRIFLTSISVLAESDSQSLAHALMGSCARNAGNVSVFHKGYGQFGYMMDCYRNVDIPAECRTKYWNQHTNTAPYRAQRLNRLCSLEEITGFFRLPIPIKPGFPGFAFDTGLETFVSRKKERSIIRLGSYLDESRADKQSAQFDSQQLAKHGLIVGVPGSGKTTAMFNILHQLWAVPDEQKIPFIILEPAKTEYRALKSLPAFKDDLLVFTLGDESVSPFRFNPLEVLPGVKIESHISKLQACFIGAFDLFDPLPIFLEQAIRRTYEEKGWYDDSRGGDPGLETPILSDLLRNARWIVENSGFDSKMRSNFQASLLERLNSLCRGSKGRMLNTQHTIPMEELMGRPVVLELDSLNSDEKSLLMMFLLTYVFEYCKVCRKSGTPLKHMLLVEEAHNLISAQGGGSENRANPKAKTIELFVNMLAEMRALGEGILIADQLPTAIAAQAVKQTNVKILMRVTAKDDREEIGNTMDLNEEQMHKVVNFKTGHAYLYHEGEDRVRMIRMLNFKGEHHVEEPQTDEELQKIMEGYQLTHKALYQPYPECSMNCEVCDRRVRSQADAFVRKLVEETKDDYFVAKYGKVASDRRDSSDFCQLVRLDIFKEAKRLESRYGNLSDKFESCAYIHLLHHAYKSMGQCRAYTKNNGCKSCIAERIQKMNQMKGEQK